WQTARASYSRLVVMTTRRLFLKCLVSRLAPVLLSGFTSQRAGVFSFQQPMPPGIKPPQHCASPDNSGLVWILRLNSSSLHP
ncbi:hypothetical protein G0T52_002227, partial [Shigella sonnei]|nr:hypothetical protein [Shigella sonnei]